MHIRALLPVLIACVCAGCDPFYDEGARFANQVADFALDFHANSSRTTAVFDYTPKYGTSQHYHVGIGRIKWCPQPPCDNQGAATVVVERGKSGTGYRIAADASVPAPLEIDKYGEPVHVFMRKSGNTVEIFDLE
jgi:hypothetical protein